MKIGGNLYVRAFSFPLLRLIVFEGVNPVLGTAPNRAIAPAAAALGGPLAAEGDQQNLGLAHGAGFELAGVVPGPAVVSADWTKL